MKFTREEKEIYAQKMFDECVNNRCNHFSVCGINSIYQFDRETNKSIYQDKFDETLKDYHILQSFNGQKFSDYPPETKIKIVNITKNIFEQLGFIIK